MDKFIKIYKGFFDSRENNNELHMTDDELSVYLAIEQQTRMLEDSYIIHLDVLLLLMGKSNTRWNKEAVEETVQKLCSKGFYTITSQQKEIYILENNLKKGKVTGFEMVDTRELKYLMKHVDKEPLIYLYLLLRVWEYDSTSTTSFSYNALAEMCRVSRRTVMRYAEELEKKGLIAIYRTPQLKNNFKTLGFIDKNGVGKVSNFFAHPKTTKKSDKVIDISKAF